MKRVMTTSVVAGLLGALGFAPAVSAEGTLYGSVRSGIYMVDPQMSGKDTTWDIGTADAGDLGQGDQLWSRIGVKASHELDGGMMAGLHIEKRLDNFRTRHQNVWLSGAFGKLTLGQQGSAYYSATTWDGTNLFGDWNRVAGSRVSGIKYSSNLGGPFNFEAMVLDSMSGSRTASKAMMVTVEDTDGDEHELTKSPAMKTGHSDGVNATQIAGTLKTDMITLSVGYMNVSADGMNAGEEGVDWYGGSAGGAMGGLDWDVGFEMGDADDENDAERYGFTLGYTMGSTRAYVHYEDLQYDDNMNENNFMVFGLSHTLAPGVVVIAEYQAADDDEDKNPNRGAVAVRVDF